MASCSSYCQKGVELIKDLQKNVLRKFTYPALVACKNQTHHLKRFCFCIYGKNSPHFTASYLWVFGLRFSEKELSFLLDYKMAIKILRPKFQNDALNH